VFPAGDGRAAVGLLRKNAAEVGAALVDHRMPGPPCAETVGLLRAVVPGLPVCVMGGSLGDGDQAALRAAGVARFLHKPVRLPEAALAVLGMMGRPAAAPVPG